MRLLHTADWHVGKLIRGQSRAHEHREVLAEIADVAGREAAAEHDVRRQAERVEEILLRAVRGPRA